jgi:hypothetical protein
MDEMGKILLQVWAKSGSDPLLSFEERAAFRAKIEPMLDRRLPGWRQGITPGAAEPATPEQAATSGLNPASPEEAEAAVLAAGKDVQRAEAELNKRGLTMKYSRG